MKIIAVLSLFISVAFSQDVSFAEKVAVISYGRDVVTNGIEHQRAKKALTQAALECELTEMQIGDKAAAVSNLLKEKGFAIMPIEILEGVLVMLDSYPADTDRDSCENLIAHYTGVLVGNNTNHSMAVIQLSSLIKLVVGIK